MTEQVFDSSIVTLVANLVVAACWYFSLPLQRAPSEVMRWRLRLNNTHLLNSGIHAFYLALSAAPYFYAGTSARLANAALCCLGFAVCTGSADFYALAALRQRIARMALVVTITIGSMILALSSQEMAMLPMGLSVLIAVMQLQQRLQDMTALAEDNAIMRDKLSELSARSRASRNLYRHPDTTKSRNAS